MEEIVIGLSLGLLIGMTLAIMGAGGSILAVPALIFAADLSIREASGTALLIVAGAALVGGFTRWRAGVARVDIAVTFGLTGIAGAFLGAWLNQQASEDVIIILLAIVMLIAALRMAQGRVDESASEEHKHIAGARLALALVVGVGLGVMTGFFGVGGGFLIVPALVLVLRLPMGWAVGTSLLVISFNATAGLAGHLAFGEVNFGAGTPALIGAALGAGLGSRFGQRIKESWLRSAFTLLLVVVAIVLLIQRPS